MKPKGSWTQITEQELEEAVRRAARKTSNSNISAKELDVAGWVRTTGRTTVVLLTDCMSGVSGGVLGCGTATRNTTDELPDWLAAPRNVFRVRLRGGKPRYINDFGPNEEIRPLNDSEWASLCTRRCAVRIRWAERFQDTGRRSALFRAVRDWLDVKSTKGTHQT